MAGSDRKPARRRARDALAPAPSEREKGRAEGLRDALLLLGVGVGIGLARTLMPSAPRCGKLTGSRLGDIYGPCRLDPDHEGACQPEHFFSKKAGS